MSLTNFAANDTTNSKRGREDDSSEDVVNLHEELMCGICHELVVNATQTPCCGGLWCRGCIEKVQQKLCPACRAPYELSKLFSDARSERLSASLKRPCKNEARGCTFKGNRSDVKDHEPNCPHLTVAEVRKEMQSEIDAVTKEKKQLGTELRNEKAEVGNLRRQLSSAQAVNSTNSITTSKLQKENGLLKGVLECDHVFSFRLQRGQSHTEQCRLYSCCWFEIDVQVKCNADKEVSLFLFRPRLPEKGVPGWTYINERSVTFRYGTNHAPSNILEDAITPPKEHNWSRNTGWGLQKWLTNYCYGALIFVGVTMR